MIEVKLTSLFVMPELFISSPARMKKGIAMKVKLSRPVKSRVAMSPRDTPSRMRYTVAAAPRLKATGTPIKMKIVNAAIADHMLSVLFSVFLGHDRWRLEEPEEMRQVLDEHHEYAEGYRRIRYDHRNLEGT